VARLGSRWQHLSLLCRTPLRYSIAPHNGTCCRASSQNNWLPFVYVVNQIRLFLLML
jgi:hypothetical protein